MKVYFKMHGPVCTTGVLSRSLVLNLKFLKRKMRGEVRPEEMGEKKFRLSPPPPLSLFSTTSCIFPNESALAPPLKMCGMGSPPSPHFAVKVVVAVEKWGLSTDVI